MKNKRLFTYVFLFGLLVNGSACGSDHNETDFPETPGGETPPSPSGLQAYMLTTTDTRTYELKESTAKFESQVSMSPKNILLNPQQTFQTMQGFGAALTGSSGSYAFVIINKSNTAKNIVLTAPDNSGKKHSANCILQPRSVNSFKWDDKNRDN